MLSLHSCVNSADLSGSHERKVHCKTLMAEDDHASTLLGRYKRLNGRDLTTDTHYTCGRKHVHRSKPAANTLARHDTIAATQRGWMRSKTELAAAHVRVLHLYC